MAASMRQQPAASLLDLRSLAGTQPTEVPCEHPRAPLDACETHCTEATPWHNRTHRGPATARESGTAAAVRRGGASARLGVLRYPRGLRN